MDNIGLEAYEGSRIEKSFNTGNIDIEKSFSKITFESIEAKVRDTFSKGLIDQETFEKALEELELLKGGNKKDFSAKERESLSKEGEAMKDGSFPIRNSQDLKDAVRSVGRAKDEATAKAWIKKRAKELDLEKELPESWEDKKIEKSEETTEDLIKEHKRLTKVLESPSHEDDKEEYKKQKKELDQYEKEEKERKK